MWVTELPYSISANIAWEQKTNQQLNMLVYWILGSHKTFYYLQISICFIMCYICKWMYKRILCMDKSHFMLLKVTWKAYFLNTNMLSLYPLSTFSPLWIWIFHLYVLCCSISLISVFIQMQNTFCILNSTGSVWVRTWYMSVTNNDCVWMQSG